MTTPPFGHVMGHVTPQSSMTVSVVIAVPRTVSTPPHRQNDLPTMPH